MLLLNACGKTFGLAHPLRVGLDQRMLLRLDRLGFPPGAVVGIAFSGGSDSLALAVAMSRCARIRDIRPVLLHIDHRLRPNSTEQAILAARLAESIGLPIDTLALAPGLPGRAYGRGIEHQARLERYAALAELCAARGSQFLATGHHRDDQAESVLLHLFRGAGSLGLAGMREVSPPPVALGQFDSTADLWLWRPLLGENKAELSAYVHSTGLVPLDDESNEETRFRRNAIRHDILPVIDRHFPGAITAISRAAELIAEDADYLDAMAVQSYEHIRTTGSGMAIDRLSQLPKPLMSRVLLRWLRQSGVPDPTRERVESIIEALSILDRGQHLEVGGGYWVINVGGELRCALPRQLIDRLIRDAGLLAKPERAPTYSPPQHGDCREWRSDSWRIQLCLDAEGITTRNQRIVVTPPGAEITIRGLQDGDTWLLTGRPVRDSLRSAGLHPIARRSVVCLAIGRQIVAVPGLHSVDQGKNMAGFTETLLGWEVSKK